MRYLRRYKLHCVSLSNISKKKNETTKRHFCRKRAFQCKCLLLACTGLKILHASHVERYKNFEILLFFYPIQWNIELSRSNVPPFNAIEMSRNILLPFARNFISENMCYKRNFCTKCKRNMISQRSFIFLSCFPFSFISSNFSAT